MTRVFARPQPGEYAPYTIDYISLVPEDGLILKHLEENSAQVDSLMRAFSGTDRTTPHAPGEWTVQDVLGHIIDTERILGYRALCFARGEKKELPGFEESEYGAVAGANVRTLDDLLTEYHAVRAATIALIRSFPDSVLTNAGVANKNPFSVRGFIYMLAGHELYHIRSIHQNYGHLLP